MGRGTGGGDFTTITLPAPATNLVWDLSYLMANGTPSGGFSVLTSTNVALPLTNWTVIANANFDSAGKFSYTNAVNPATPPGLHPAAGAVRKRACRHRLALH